MTFNLNRVSVCFLSLVLISTLASAPAVAEERSGGFFKDKIRAVLLKKLQSQPAPEVTASVTTPITAAGDYTFSITHDGLTRMYMVHVPESYRAAKAAPLLFALHGGGGDMNYMAKDEYYGLIAKSEEQGYVAVFPNGFSNFASGKLATWNAGACCGNARDNKIDDVGFIRDIVKNITSQMNIDRNRIYATGMSNGGMMSERLACEAADIFSAIASVAGPDGTLQCAPSRPISVLQIHALNDDHVLFNGGAGQNAFQDLSTVTDFVSIPETVSRWVQRNNCSHTPERVLKVDGAYCDLFSGCAGGAKVQLCVTDVGAHSWPGGSKPGGKSWKKEPTSKAISADDEMWNFFNSLH